MPLTNPPNRTKLVNSDGTITWPWLKWFETTQQLVNTVQGAVTSVTQANLPSLPASSAGDLYFVTDYNHLLQWNGTGWQWGPGENGSGFVQNFLQAGAQPGTGWHVCDGSSQKVLNSNGTLATVTLPLMGNAGQFGNMVAYFRQ